LSSAILQVKPALARGSVTYETKGVFEVVQGKLPMSAKEIEMFELGLNINELSLLGSAKNLSIQNCMYSIHELSFFILQKT